MNPVVKTPMIFCMISLDCSTSNEKKQNQMYHIENNIVLKTNHHLKSIKENHQLSAL
ncbi:hypothetical protein [Aquimarina algiphila]|uniref:hypothetical protein n=1 Tax=Aquimarina algiphila TaxID=2047982 RepID=UPI00232AC080|nr:hypothetical protein [Aquimarina algiphila]